MIRLPQNDKRPSATSLAAAWGEYLAPYAWDHWLTLTFAPPRPLDLGGPFRLGPARRGGERPGPPPDYAHREFRRFVRRLEDCGSEPVWWFRGDELGERLGRLHLHALLGGTGGLLEASLSREWRVGFSLVKRYDPALGAAHYVTKYATKGLADYDVSGGWRCEPLQPRLPFSEERGQGAPRSPIAGR
ncbi:hypothetical protein LCGC14_2327250 [marine sediment metagenome]|uniref:Replication-associated protein ORF2/G2P domain-containing protein n=1 Tax=marine sediment metagenome TaxID=412755 RepID=A0A0F9ETK1_9ZZZZ